MVVLIAGNLSLFSLLEKKLRQMQKLTVVIDANVFYDLNNPVAPDAEESKALQADWLQSSVELRITPEGGLERDQSAQHPKSYA